MKALRGWAFIAACGLLSTSGRAKETVSATGAVHVRVVSLLPQRKRLAWALFRSADGFPSDREKAQMKGFADIDETLVVNLEFADLAYGTYAVAVFQDLDDSGKLEKNFLGIPQEPIGFTQNPTLYMGPPKFSRAAFEMKAPKQDLEIKMIH